ncbi:hypothetical protein FKM82_027363 [Ascaphus truei]
MDNFEYSIQINDRDWAEFYSAAEECDLMHVSLAAEEDLVLSDPEHADPTSTSWPKFMRVSLCPAQSELPAVQSPLKPVPPVKQLRYGCVAPNEDVLSGSEDEEDLGNVNRFLCQGAAPFPRIKLPMPGSSSPRSSDIPVLKQAEEQHKDYPSTETSHRCAVGESLVAHLRALHIQKGQNLEEEVQQGSAENIQRNRFPVICDEDVETERFSNGHAPFVQPAFLSQNSEGSLQLQSANHSRDCALLEMQSSLSVNGSSPARFFSGGDTEGTVRSSCPEVYPIASDLDDKPNETVTGVQVSLSQSATASFGRGCQRELGHLNGAKESSEPTNNTESEEGLRVPPDTKHDAMRRNLIQHALEGNSNPMQRDVLMDSSLQVASSGISEQPFHHRSPPLQLSSSSQDGSSLTIPEMYEFFYDDMSESRSSKAERHNRREEGIMYTPEMYEYFFLENHQEENINEMIEERQSRADLVSTSFRESKSKTTSEALCVPEAYEYFFADGAEDQADCGIVLRLPAFQAQSTAAALQSRLPSGLCRVSKGIAVRGTHPRRGRDERLNAKAAHEHRGTPEEMSAAATGSAPHVSSGRGDACLVFLAFASWAVKSSDLQSADGWKTGVWDSSGCI